MAVKKSRKYPVFSFKISNVQDHLVRYTAICVQQQIPFPASLNYVRLSYCSCVEYFVIISDKWGFLNESCTQFSFLLLPHLKVTSQKLCLVKGNLS